MKEKENTTVYAKTLKLLSYLVLASILILMLSYAYGWSFIVPFIFGLIAMILITSSSLAFGFVFFRDNEDIDNGVIYSRKQKILITLLSLIPALVFYIILTSSHYGNVERDKICNSKEYAYKDVCSQVLKDLYVVFKYNDSQAARAVQEVKASAAYIIDSKTADRQLEERIDAQDRRWQLEKEAKKQEEEQERKTLNININVHINIPGIDVIEQKIPLKIDPNSTKDIDINVTKP